MTDKTTHDRNRRRRWQSAAGAILIAVAATPASSCNMAESLDEAERTRELEISTPALSEIPPGTYRGSYEAGMVSAEVEAVVAAGTITTLTLLHHDNWRGGDAEQLIDQIVQEQSLELDVVSGATISSKTILKATEVALTSSSQ
ncbi:MAG: FMN-binding protein [Alkalispirochaeta sp.]